METRCRLNWHGSLSLGDKTHSTVSLENLLKRWIIWRGASSLMETWATAHDPAAATDQLVALPSTWLWFSPGPHTGNHQLSLHSLLGERSQSRWRESTHLKPTFRLLCSLLLPPSAISQCYLVSFPGGSPDIPCCVLGGLSPLHPEKQPAHGTKTFPSQTQAHRTRPTGATHPAWLVLHWAALACRRTITTKMFL